MSIHIHIYIFIYLYIYIYMYISINTHTHTHTHTCMHTTGEILELHAEIEKKLPPGFAAELAAEAGETHAGGERGRGGDAMED